MVSERRKLTIRPCSTAIERCDWGYIGTRLRKTLTRNHQLANCPNLLSRISWRELTGRATRLQAQPLMPFTNGNRYNPDLVGAVWVVVGARAPSGVAITRPARRWNISEISARWY
jgi:hypothetical protein